MKALFYLIADKQKWRLLCYALLLIITCTLFALGKHYAQSAVKIPIAIQDLDSSRTSKAIVKALENNKTLTIRYLDTNDSFIEDVVKKKYAVISLSIPKSFEKNLKKRHVRKSVQLYEKGDFVSTIGVELISKTFFEMQIPYIVKHYEKQPHTLSEIEHTYHQYKPTDTIKHKAMYHSTQSIQMGILLVLLLIVSVSQLFFQQNLTQQNALQRVYYFKHMKYLLPVVYTCVNVAIFFTIFLVATWMIDGQLGIQFYMISFILIAFHTLCMCVCLLKINTLSHRTFIASSLTLCFVGLVILIQL